MKLSIDTSNAKEVQIKLDDEAYSAPAYQDKSQKILAFIDEVLKSRQMTIHDISEIEVHTGPGSFTGIRVGVSVAQAIGFALSIPVNGELVTKNQIKLKYE